MFWMGQVTSARCPCHSKAGRLLMRITKADLELCVWDKQVLWCLSTGLVLLSLKSVFLQENSKNDWQCKMRTLIYYSPLLTTHQDLHNRLPAINCLINMGWNLLYLSAKFLLNPIPVGKLGTKKVEILFVFYTYSTFQIKCYVFFGNNWL